MKWTIDPGHSEAQFKIRHLAIATVVGRFRKFEGTVESTTEDFSNAQVHVTLDTASIDTNNPQRDGHLVSPDFFHAEKYPAITFTGVLQTGQLAGELTIGETTHPVTLETTFHGIGKGRYGDTRAGFEATGKINRKDFGLSWNIPGDGGGGLVIGEEVKLAFEIELIAPIPG